MRTALTAVTLTLLTFTVLSFTSFRTGIQFYTLDRENTPPYEGVLMRSLSWHSLPTFFRALRGKRLRRTRRRSCPGRGTSPRISPAPTSICALPGTGTATTVQVILGLHADEPAITGLDRYLVPGGRWFAPDERAVCLLPTELAERLDLGPEDVGTAEVEILGGRYTVIGLLDSGGLDAYRDMDDERYHAHQFFHDPYADGRGRGGVHVHDPGVRTPAIPQRAGPALSADPRPQRVHAVRGDRGDSPTAISSGTPWRPSMSRVLLAVFVGMEDEVKVYSSLGATSVSGLANLIIPGAHRGVPGVEHHDGRRVRTVPGDRRVQRRRPGAEPRRRPCSSPKPPYSRHSAQCFGYLAGQIITMGLSQWDLLGGMSLNYSSLSTVYATMVVMAIVFLSTLYPAKKAADMTVEDVTRRWSPPPPDGDDWRFEFPFTVTVPEALPLSGYLNHIFQTHEDSSAEDFVAEGTTLDAIPGDTLDTYHVAATVWLAPYDLAISQDVRLELEPVLHERLYRILIVIRRRSGDLAQWQTINRRFFTVLRKRFLVWRTLAEPIKARYREIKAFDRHTAL